MAAVPLFVTYSTNGAYAWTCPPGVTSVTVACTGAGGGGGSASNTSGTNGGGGGGGASAIEPSVAVTPGAVYQLNVGVGGAGGAAGTDGTVGTETLFTGDGGFQVAAAGGAGGTAGVGGAGQGAAGGGAGANTVSAAGGAGDDGTVSANGGGGGGAAGGTVTAGIPGASASGATAGAGTGGAVTGGVFPGGAGGAGAASAGPGSNGSGPGGGGGGALSTGTQHGGGNGADGQVILTWTATDPITLNAASPGAVVQMQPPLGASTVQAECWGGGAGGFNSQSSGGAVAASTTFTPGYGGGTLLQAATTFDGYVSRPLALAAQNVYQGGDTGQEGAFQSSLTSPKDLSFYKTNGVKVYYCCEPDRLAVVNGGSALTTARSNLAAGITALNSALGAGNWVMVFWQEGNGAGRHGPFGDNSFHVIHSHGTFPTTPALPSSGTAIKNTAANAGVTGAFDLFANIVGAGVTNVVVNGTSVGSGAGTYKLPANATIAVTYTGTVTWGWWATPYGGLNQVTDAQASANHIAMWNAYAPTVRAGSPAPQLAYKPAVYTNQTAIDCFPGTGNTGCDFIMADWYTTDLVKSGGVSIFSGPYGTNTIEAVADAAGIGLGVGEWGLANGTNAPSQAQWNTFITEFARGLNARITAGKPIQDVLFYTGQNAGGANNLTGPSDFKVAGIQQVSDIVTSAGSATAVGGAGGGGGEYAAEASLAIPSPAGTSLYTLTVGAGGPGRTSGSNTTVAGQSVTVTAHGGSVATTQSAGGAGGTGYASGTHHDGGAGGVGALTFGGTTGTGGGGGGGSGGTSSAGNAGSAGVTNTGGAGATAVSGGGPGGKGGNNSQNGSPPTVGPGGGGGARGAAGLNNGGGADGQIKLSSFTFGTSSTGNVTLGPLTASGSGHTSAGGAAMGSLTASATGTVNGFSEPQNGVLVTSTSGTLTLTLPLNSTAGTLLVAQIVVTGLTNTTGPAGWFMLASQAVGNSGVSHAETWMYNPSGDGKTGGNPGGIASAAWTFTGTTARGHLAEYASVPNTVAQNKSVTGASGGPPATSFAVSTGSGTLGGDLGVVIYNDLFTATTSGTWTAPSGWTSNRAFSSGASNLWASYYDAGLNAGTNTATGQFSTSTNQTGWAAIIAAFTAVPLVTATGAASLAQLTAAASGTVGIPVNTVVTNGSVALAPLTVQSPSQQVTFPADPLPIMVEILINGTWTDVTGYVYQRDGITISGRGRPNEASTAQPAQVTMTLNNRDGSFSPQNTSGQFYGFLVRNTQIRISVNTAVTSQGAWYSGARFYGEVVAWPPLWDPSGTDVYVSITAAGVLQRMSQSKYSASSVTRYYTNIINAANAGPAGQGALEPAAWWSCEDASNSASFTSNLPGGSPMTWTGSPSLGATDSSGPGGTNLLPGVTSFAQLNGSTWTGTPGVFTSGGVTYLTPGTYQWTCPGGVSSINVECWGGGGGGTNGWFGNGGGGGEYAAEIAGQGGSSGIAVTPGNTYTVVVGTGGQGAPGSFTQQRGQNGAQSTFTGDSKTVKAHGGTGGNYIGSSGNGGTGSTNSTHHDGGNGASHGTGNGGTGGGSSGGTGSAGNNGHTESGNSGGGGGAVATGGGPGGAGGQGANTSQGAQATGGLLPSTGPGGGGGSGGFSGYNSFGRAGGNGYAGQVRLTFGTSTTPPANVVRAIIDIPPGGGTDQANMLSFTTSGDIANAQLSYHTAGGGSLQFAGHASGGATLFDSGIQSFSCNGQPMLVSCELTSKGVVFSGSPTTNWKLTAVTPGSGAVVQTFKGTVTGSIGLGNVTQVNVNNTAGHIDNGATGVGQITVQYAVDPILNLSQSLNAHTGELAASRFLRLCGEQNVPVQLQGSPPDTPQMGPQPTGLLVDLLQDCENADLGQMYELRDSFGMGYRTRVSMQNQAAAAVLDYSRAQLAQGLTPTNDDQLTRNDIIATRGNGSTTGTSYETVLTTGPLSVQDPPNGVGLYSYTVTANLFSDSQLAAFATWLLDIGTLDEFRYPVITIDLSRAEVSDGTFGLVAALDIGDFVKIVNPPSWLPPGDINQLCFGFTETLNAFTWTIAINAVPEDPYTAGSSGNNTTLPTW